MARNPFAIPDTPTLSKELPKADPLLLTDSIHVVADEQVPVGPSDFKRSEAAQVVRPHPADGGGVQVKQNFVEDEFDLRAVSSLLRRRIGLIVVITCMLFSVIAPQIMRMEQIYSAQLRLLLSRPNSMTLALLDTRAPDALDTATEIERLKAHMNVKLLIAELGLADLSEFNPPLPEPTILTPMMDTLRGLFDTEPAEKQLEPDTEPVIRNFYNALNIWQNGPSRVIQINFSSSDPVLAAMVPNRLVEIYLEQRSSQNEAEVASGQNWLSHRIDAQRERITELEAAAEVFRAADGVRSDAETGGGSVTGADARSEDSRLGAPVRIATLNDRLADLMRAKANHIAALSEINAGAIPSLMADAAGVTLLSELKLDLQVQQSELTSLLETYGESHREITTRTAKLAATEAAIDTAVETLGSSLRQRIAASDAELLQVQAELVVAREAATRAAKTEAEYQFMVNNLEQERNLLGALEEQQRRLDSQTALPVLSAEILSPASVPEWPDGRGRKFYLAAALLASICLATMTAFLRELLDRTVRSQQQFWGQPAIITAGLIPVLHERGGMTMLERLHLQSDSPFADAFRWLALSLQRGSGAVPSSILVTSALPRDETSEVAAALAATLSAAGHKILLVDADLRFGSLHQQFGMKAGPGLSELSSGCIHVDQVIQTDTGSGIKFVGRGIDHSSGFVQPDVVKAILQYGSANGLTVLFAAPPVLATTEASQMAMLIDQCLLVVRWGRTPLRVAGLALDRLVTQNGNAVAVTINRVEPSKLASYNFADSHLFDPALRNYWAGRS